MPSRTRLTAALVAAGLTLAACGGDDGGDSTTAATTTAAASAATTTAASVSTTAAAAATTTTARATTTVAVTTTAATATTTAGAGGATTCSGMTAPAAGATAVSTTLVEWAVNSPATVQAGAAAFTIKNEASDRHQFMLVKGTYATAAKLTNGALDEAQLGANLVGKIDLNGNQTCAAGFTLAPGPYLIVCNINQGPNSHAARGQKLDFTVA